MLVDATNGHTFHPMGCRHSGDPLHPSHPQGRRMVGFCLGGTHRPNTDHVGKPHPGCVTSFYHVFQLVGSFDAEPQHQFRR